MAIEKILNTRLMLKTATLEEWNASTLGLKKGEIAIATVAATAGNGLAEPVCMIKIGEDGVKTFSQLPWNFYAKASDVIAAAKSESTLTQFIKDVLTAEGVASDSVVSALSGRVDALETAVGDAESGLVKAVADLQGLVGDENVADRISNAIKALDLDNTYAAKKHEHTKADITDFAHEHAISEVTGLQDALDNLQAKGDYAAEEHTHVIADITDIATITDAIAEAKQAGDDAQDAVDALAGKVGDVPVDKTVVQMIADAQAEATYDDTDVKADIADLKGKVGDTDVATQITNAIDEALKVEGAEKYALAGHKHEIADVNGLSGAISDAKQAGLDANAALETYKGTNDAAVQKVAEDLAAEAEAARAAEKANADAIDALEAKIGEVAEDKTVVDMIADAKAEATYDDTALAGRVTALEDLVGDDNVPEAISAAVKVEKERAEGVEAGLEERLKAVEDTYATDDDVAGLQNQINTIMNNPDAEGAINSINEFTQYVKDHGTIADGFRADIDKNKEDITGLAGRMDTAEGAIALKAAQADLEALDGRVDTIESDLNTAETGLKAKVAALESKVGDQNVAERISAVTDPMSEKITALEGKAHEHANKEELDKIADGDKAKWDAKLEDVTAAADSGLKATKTGNTVAIEIDESVTFIFDCGGAV